MIKPILQVGNPILTKPSQEVTDFASDELNVLIKDLLDTCKAGAEFTAGLAAPQIGGRLAVCVLNRLDLVETENDGGEAEQKREIPAQWEVLINPKITALDDQETMFWEACLSIGVGEKQLWGPVWRPAKVRVDYQDVHGAKQSFEATEFFAHLVQHEADHLAGILFISRVANPEHNLWKSKDIDLYLDQNHEFPPIKE